jgi:hypothetical protein
MINRQTISTLLTNATRLAASASACSARIAIEPSSGSFGQAALSGETLSAAASFL